MEVAEEDGRLAARDDEYGEHHEQEAEHVVRLVRPAAAIIIWTLHFISK